MFDKYTPLGMGETSEGQIKAYKEEVMKRIRNDNSGRNIRFKRTGKTVAIWAACIAAVSALSVSAAAAGGLIDFNALFGGFYKPANENVASAIMKSAENIVCETSDSDYVINIKGIAGDETTVLISAELCRADGTPVKEHFLNTVDEVSLLPLDLKMTLSERDGDQPNGAGGSGCFVINDEGNIDLTASVTSFDPMNGKRVTIKENTLFDPNEDYYRKLLDDVDMETAAKDHIALDLSIEISFDYNYSEEDVVTKTAASDEPFTYRMTLIKNIPESDFTRETLDIEAAGLKITAGAVNCVIEFEYPIAKYEDINYDEYMIDHRDNELFLIMSDGSHTAMEMSSYNWSLGSEMCHYTDTLNYCDSSYTRMIADIENAEAISINGTVYQLN